MGLTINTRCRILTTSYFNHYTNSHHTDGNVCIDSHDRALFQRNATSQELSALYNDN